MNNKDDHAIALEYFRDCHDRNLTALYSDLADLVGYRVSASTSCVRSAIRTLRTKGNQFQVVSGMGYQPVPHQSEVKWTNEKHRNRIGNQADRWGNDLNTVDITGKPIEEINRLNTGLAIVAAIQETVSPKTIAHVYAQNGKLFPHIHFVLEGC